MKQIGWFRDCGSQFAVNFELYLQVPQLLHHLLQTRITANLRSLHIEKVGLSATPTASSKQVCHPRPGLWLRCTYAPSSLPLLEAPASTLLDVLHHRKHAISCGIERVVSSWMLCQWHVKSTVTNAYRNVVQVALPASGRT